MVGCSTISTGSRRRSACGRPAPARAARTMAGPDRALRLLALVALLLGSGSGPARAEDGAPPEARYGFNWFPPSAFYEHWIFLFQPYWSGLDGFGAGVEATRPFTVPPAGRVRGAGRRGRAQGPALRGPAWPAERAGRIAFRGGPLGDGGALRAFHPPAPVLGRGGGHAAREPRALPPPQPPQLPGTPPPLRPVPHRRALRVAGLPVPRARNPGVCWSPAPTRG